MFMHINPSKPTLNILGKNITSSRPASRNARNIIMDELLKHPIGN